MVAHLEKDATVFGRQAKVCLEETLSLSFITSSKSSQLMATWSLFFTRDPRHSVGLASGEKALKFHWLQHGQQVHLEDDAILYKDVPNASLK